MSRRPRTPGPRFVTERGIPVFLEASHALPLVDVEILLRRGTLTDPDDLAGLTRTAVRLMRSGPRGMSKESFDQTLDGLGASLGASVAPEHLRFHGTVIRRNLEPYLELVGRMLAEPGLRAADLARVKRKGLAELVQLKDHDRALAARAFRRHLFGAHPYGRPVTGTVETLRAVRRADVRAQHEELFRAGDLLIGVAGDVTEETVRPLVERSFGKIARGSGPPSRTRAPKLRRGRRVVVVDKPQRAQVQLYVGTLGIQVGHPDHHALLVANTGFGGTFTSRLMKEVRSKRGWSYGAGSKLGADRQREAWTMWTHPGAEQLLDCLRLELDLMDAWAERGLSGAEVQRAKRFLVKSHAFDLETAAKRLEPQLDTALYGLPDDWHAGFVRHIRGVTKQAAARAVREHLSPQDLTLAMVATVDDRLLAGLRELPGVRTVDVLSLDQV